MLLFSEYDKSLENIYISQPVVDINLGDTNNYLVRFPKFKKAEAILLLLLRQTLTGKNNTIPIQDMDKKTSQRCT